MKRTGRAICNEFPNNGKPDGALEGDYPTMALSALIPALNESEVPEILEPLALLAGPTAVVHITCSAFGRTFLPQPRNQNIPGIGGHNCSRFPMIPPGVNGSCALRPGWQAGTGP